MSTFKKLFIPSGEKTTITAYKSWIVRWKSVEHKEWSIYADLKHESEIFPSEEDAKNFANQIQEAYKLTKSSLHKSVLIEENQNKLASFPTT